MIIRVRSKDGIWRVPDLHLTSRIADIEAFVSKTYGIKPEEQAWFLDQQQTKRVTRDQTLSSLKLKHGDMLFLHYEGDHSRTQTATSKKVLPDGTVVAVGFDENSKKKGFRPGMMALRDIKMHWTIGEFFDMDSQFSFKIKRQKDAHCARASLDTASCNDFQSYLRRFAFQQSRCAFLYGKALANNEICVDCIYEPPQNGYPEGFELLEDPLAERVEIVTTALGLEKVGWMFSHPPREEEGFRFTSAEILMSAQYQLEAGGHGSPFVTVTVTLDKEGHAAFDAYQMSDQCMEMAASGALEVNPDKPDQMKVNDTFTAIVEGKSASTIDNDFFLVLVPIVQHDAFLRNTFPKKNRLGGEGWSKAALRAHMTKYRQLPYVERLADFNLLLYLCDFLDARTEVAAICQSVASRGEIPLDSGFPLIIDSIAGLSS